MAAVQYDISVLPFERLGPQFPSEVKLQCMLGFVMLSPIGYAAGDSAGKKIFGIPCGPIHRVPPQ